MAGFIGARERREYSLTPTLSFNLVTQLFFGLKNYLLYKTYLPCEYSNPRFSQFQKYPVRLKIKRGARGDGRIHR